MSADAVTVSASIQVRINGNDAWIKAEYHSDVEPAEDASIAFRRVTAQVNKSLMESIETTAQSVIEYENTRKS